LGASQPKSFGFYWKFYWPLTFMGLTLVLGRQFQNGFLAHVPNPVFEIAVFAIASSIFGIFSEGFAFVPQMANVMVNGNQDFKVAKRFLLLVISVELLFLVLLIFTPSGNQLLIWCFALSEEMLQKVCYYLMAMIPLLFSQCFYQFYTGLLIQRKKTGYVTVLNVCFLGIMVLLLFLGYYFQANIVIVLMGSQLIARLIQLFLTWFLFVKSDKLLVQSSTEQTKSDYWTFFWPVALTSSMFSLSRPILYAFVSRLPDSAIVIASLRLAFDANMIFQNMANQFRHLFITYAKDDLKGVVSFMFKTTWGITIGMVLMVVTGLLTFLLQDFMSIPKDVTKLACEIFFLLCLIPLIIGYRNYYHGSFLLLKKTKVMGLGGVVRIILTFVSSWLFFELGVLNHWTAATALLLGFLAELFMNIWAFKQFYTNSPNNI